jgi:hypothetical protein
MPCTFEYIPDEPIMIVHFYASAVETDVMQQVFDATAAFIEKVGGHVWRINDYEKVDIPPTMLINMAKAAQLAGKKIPGSTSDPNVSVILVGRNYASQVFREFMAQQQFGAVKMPIFDTIEQALEAVRFQIEEMRRSDNLTN